MSYQGTGPLRGFGAEPKEEKYTTKVVQGHTLVVASPTLFMMVLAILQSQEATVGIEGPNEVFGIKVPSAVQAESDKGPMMAAKWLADAKVNNDGVVAAGDVSTKLFVRTRDPKLAADLIAAAGDPDKAAVLFEPNGGWEKAGSSSAAVGDKNLMWAVGIGLAGVLGYMVYQGYQKRERSWPA